jgi:hypothetical protein
VKTFVTPAGKHWKKGQNMTTATDALQRLDDAVIATDRGPERSYVGASNIGHECFAYLQMALRGIPGKTPPPNALRIFRLGHVLEEEIVNDLKAAGYAVREIDPETGEQWEWLAFGGHLRAHADGILRDKKGPAILLEIKTMNDKKWNLFKARGIKNSHPMYYSQMQIMMALGSIEEAMMVSYNKNTSTYHVEMVPYQADVGRMLLEKARMIIKNGYKTRVVDWPDSFSCKYCDRFDACWITDSEIPKNCKTCNHSTPHKNQQWWCNKNQKLATKICDHYSRFTVLGRK